MTDFPAMRKRAVLALCAALVVATWGVFALVLASSGGPAGSRHMAGFVFYLVLGAGLTWWATELVVREWRGTMGKVAAAPISALAILATLWLSLTSETLPLWIVGVVDLGVMPFGFGFGAGVFLEKRGPMSKRQMALVAAGLALCYGLTGLTEGVGGAVAWAVAAYFPSLLGVWAGRRFERRHMRRRSDLSEEAGLLT